MHYPNGGAGGHIDLARIRGDVDYPRTKTTGNFPRDGGTGQPVTQIQIDESNVGSFTQPLYRVHIGGRTDHGMPPIRHNVF